MEQKSCYLVFGRKVRRARKNLELKQIDLAVEADLNRTYISRIETGKARVTFNLLYKLVRGLGITSEELISNDDIYRGNLGYISEGGIKNV
jgi:transcriptional regulator with XRE-family HTH domain